MKTSQLYKLGIAHWLSKIDKHTQRYKESLTDKQTHWQTADAHIHVCINKQRNTHRDRETSPQWPHWGHRKMAIVERWLLWEGVSAHVCMSSVFWEGARGCCVKVAGQCSAATPLAKIFTGY